MFSKTEIYNTDFKRDYIILHTYKVLMEYTYCGGEGTVIYEITYKVTYNGLKVS
jgi:hypothetical protein